MPPKAVAGAAEPNADVLVLIHLIRTATDFKIDTAKMAEICKISHAKNVPRKINSVLAPHGFKWVAGKIEQDGAAKDKDHGEDADQAVLKTPAKTPKKSPKTPKSKEPKTPNSNKKRKIEEEEEEEEAEPEVDDADIIKGEEDEAAGSAVNDEDGDVVDAATKEGDSTEED